MFAKDTADKAAKLQGLGKALAAYMDKHPEIDTVYYGRADGKTARANWARIEKSFAAILFSTITTS